MQEAIIIQKPVLCKSMDWFLYDNDLRHERVEGTDIETWEINTFNNTFWYSTFNISKITNNIKRMINISLKIFAHLLKTWLLNLPSIMRSLKNVKIIIYYANRF